MQFEFNPEVMLLLQNYSEEKVVMLYDSDHTWPMPKIGPRPPYYFNPRYVQSYPLI